MIAVSLVASVTVRCGSEIFPMLAGGDRAMCWQDTSTLFSSEAGAVTIFLSTVMLASPLSAQELQFSRLLKSLNEFGNGAASLCGETLRKEWVKEVTNDWYLWNDELAYVDPDDHRTADTYLSALTAPLAEDGRDPGFSYVTTRQRDEAQFTSGSYVGFGFRSGLGAENRLYLADVFEDGPAWNAEFRRGMEVLAVDTGDGFELWTDLLARAATMEEVFGPSEIGTNRGFRLLDRDGRITETYVEKNELKPPAIAGEPTLIERSGLAPVGYLNLRQFTQSARASLTSASKFFQRNRVTDFVIDLRYNGGGLLSVADLMLDLLGGRIANQQTSFYLAHNDQRSEYNTYAYFNERPESVDPRRFVFITTDGTASASELVINSLAPHSEVVMVGTDTRGKAVGQYAFDQPSCDARLRLVSFEILNGEGLGGYYNGLAATGRVTLCPANDELSKAFADPEEDSLSASLQWLEESACRPRATGSARPSKEKRDLPEWLTAPTKSHELMNSHRH